MPLYMPGSHSVLPGAHSVGDFRGTDKLTQLTPNISVHSGLMLTALFKSTLVWLLFFPILPIVGKFKFAYMMNCHCAFMQ